MLRPFLPSLLLAVLFGIPALAQEGGNLESPQASGGDFVPAPAAAEPLWSSPQSQEPSMANDLWLYLHEQRRHDDAKQAVRRKAEIKAAQRQQRIATLNWYGWSNQRPMASSNPFMGTYSPSWAGIGATRYGWVGSERRIASPIVVEGSRR